MAKVDLDIYLEAKEVAAVTIGDITKFNDGTVSFSIGNINFVGLDQETILLLENLFGFIKEVK